MTAPRDNLVHRTDTNDLPGCTGDLRSDSLTSEFPDRFSRTEKLSSQINIAIMACWSPRQCHLLDVRFWSMGSRPGWKSQVPRLQFPPNVITLMSSIPMARAG